MFKANTDPHDFYHLCPGQKLRVFWVQYIFQPDGSQTIYSDHIGYLTLSNPTNTSFYPDPPGSDCTGDLYYVTGTSAIISTIKPGKHDPYPSNPGKGLTGGAVAASYGQPCPIPSAS